MKVNAKNPNAVILDPNEIKEAIQMFLDSKKVIYDPQSIKWNISGEFYDSNINCVLFKEESSDNFNKEKIYDLIKEFSTVEPNLEIEPEHTFIDNLGYDSIDFWQLIFAVEDEFHIDINYDTCTVFKTVREFVGFISEQIKKIGD